MIPYLRIKTLKTIPYKAAHTFLAYIIGVPLGFVHTELYFPVH